MIFVGCYKIYYNVRYLCRIERVLKNLPLESRQKKNQRRVIKTEVGINRIFFNTAYELKKYAFWKYEEKFLSRTF